MTEVEIRIERSTAACPGCGTAMFQLNAERGVVAGCTACGGTWLDHLAARHLIGGTLTDYVKAFIAHIGRNAAGTAPETYRSPGRRDERTCPVCHAHLVARAVGLPPVTLDLCEAHGTYFDVREIDEVAAKGEDQRDTEEAVRIGERNARIFSVVHGFFAGDQGARRRY